MNRSSVLSKSALSLVAAALGALGCAGAHANQAVPTAATVASPREAALAKASSVCFGYNGSEAERGVACLAAADTQVENGDLLHAADAFEHACVFDVARACDRTGDLFSEGTVRPKNPKAAHSYYVHACDLGRSEACAKLPASEVSATERTFRLFIKQLNEIEFSGLEAMKGAPISSTPGARFFACKLPLVGFEPVVEMRSGGSFFVNIAPGSSGETPPEFERVLDLVTRVNASAGGTRTDSGTDAPLALQLAAMNSGGKTSFKINKVFRVSRKELSVFFFRGDGGRYMLAVDRSP